MFEASQVITWGSVAGLVTILVFVGGFVFKGVTWVRNLVSASGKILHQRCDRLDEEQKDMRKDFVRRDDLTTHISGIEKMLGDMKGEQRRTNDRMDKLLRALVTDKT